jgi:hypothetical protein
LLAQAQSCASVRTGCAGLQEVGPSPNCVYPAWVLATPANVVVGYAMWQLTSGNCYYAMGIAIPPK